MIITQRQARIMRVLEISGRHVGVAQIAAQTGIGHNECGENLRALWSVGLVLRERVIGAPGVMHVYTLPDAPIPYTVAETRRITEQDRRRRISQLDKARSMRGKPKETCDIGEKRQVVRKAELRQTVTVARPFSVFNLAE